MSDNRALDRAVAEALGWECIDAVCGVGNRPSDSRGYFDRIPNYSTDPAALPEMLAWLRTIGNLFIQQYEADGAWHVDADVWWKFHSKRWPGFRAATSGRCETISEAVAKLVADVHKAKKEQGK